MAVKCIRYQDLWCLYF